MPFPKGDGHRNEAYEHLWLLDRQSSSTEPNGYLTRNSYF